MTDPWIKSAVDRIETLEEERRAIGSDVRDVYGEVKDKGFNAKALRKIISERRQKDAKEIADAMDGYRVALGMAVEAVRDGMSLDAASEEYGFSRSSIHRASHWPRNDDSGMTEMTAGDLGEWLPPHDAGTGELPREMTADDLGDPLWVVDRDRAKFKEKIKRIASTLKPAQEVGAGDTRGKADTGIDLTIPPFLRRERVTA
jgi:uncharacterized protein (UPF0335 family)